MLIRFLYIYFSLFLVPFVNGWLEASVRWRLWHWNYKLLVNEQPVFFHGKLCLEDGVHVKAHLYHFAVGPYDVECYIQLTLY